MAKVFAVLGGHDYEGEDAGSVKVFVSREAAEAYGKSLTAEQADWSDVRYDYYEVIETEME